MIPLDTSWQPATFQERGVAVPFTSPLLAGGRVRLAERGCELVVPHPGGVRGVYIFGLAALTDFCMPTLHDLQLVARLEQVRPISPRSIRLSVRAVAIGGAAGRQAAMQARLAVEQEGRLRQAFELFLLQAGAGEPNWVSSALTSANGQAAGVEHAALQLASHAGRHVDGVRADLGQLPLLLAGAGLDQPICAADARKPAPAVQQGRCQLLLAEMGALGAEVRAWGSASGTGLICNNIADAALAVREAGRFLLGTMQALLSSPDQLLARWGTSPEALADGLGRPDLLLDGWQHLCLIWQFAKTDTQRAAAALEIVALIPPMPCEAEAWIASRAELLAPLRRRPRFKPRAEIQKPPSAADLVCLVARNERLRGLAV